MSLCFDDVAALFRHMTATERHDPDNWHGPKKTSFEDRLARIRSKNPHPCARKEPEAPRPVRPSRGPSMRMQLLSTGIGLALMAGVVGYIWDDMPVLFPESEDGRKASHLEAALRDSMTEEELKEMNEGSRLDGMTQMQKMIMMH